MSVRLNREEFDEMVNANPAITYRVMGGAPDAADEKPEKTQNKRKDKSQKEKAGETTEKGKPKKRKYRNNKVYEYADGEYTLNERRPKIVTADEIAALMGTIQTVETELNNTKTSLAVFRKLGKEDFSKRLEKKRAQIDKLKSQIKDTSDKEKEYKAIEDLRLAAAAARMQIDAFAQREKELKEKLQAAKEELEYAQKGVEKEIAIYDSVKEYKRWQELQMLQRAGAISDLRRQVPYIIQPGFVYAEEKIQPIIYTADFEYTQNGNVVVEDVKGIDKKTGREISTKDFKLKWKMLKYHFPQVIFRIY